METIKTYEDACTKLGVDAHALPDVSMLEEKHQKSVLAYCKLILISEALNDGWVPDYGKYDECKYHPWFVKKPAGFGFSAPFCDYWDTHTNVGSRLVFKTRELADYAGTQFIDLYNDYLTL